MRLRYGLTDAWEAQLAVPLFEQLDTNGTGRGLSVAGTGDVSLALKRALTSGDGPVSTAALAVVSFPTGKRQFSSGAVVYSLGAYVEAGWQFPPHGEPANEVAGGGLTWLVKPTVQIDVFGLAGLTKRSTDLAAGWGISWFVP